MSLRLPGLVDWGKHPVALAARHLGHELAFDAATLKRELTSTWGDCAACWRAPRPDHRPGLALFGYLSNLLLLPLVLFYLVRDWQQFTRPLGA